MALRKTKESKGKQLVALLKDLDADGSLKQKSFKYLRCNLAMLRTVDDFTEATSNLAALSTILSQFGTEYKDFVKTQFDMLKELRNLQELRDANRMLSQHVLLNRIMAIIQSHCPKHLHEPMRSLLNDFLTRGEDEEEDD
jgi:hypothetical protein